MPASRTLAYAAIRLALLRSVVAVLALVAAVAGALAPVHAQAVDPAVRYMDMVAQELIAASRTRSAATLQSVIVRHADLAYMGGQGLGDFSNQLSSTEKPAFLSGMARWMARFATSEADKYPISHVTFQPSARAARLGLMVDSTIHMRDGASYDVAWLLARNGTSYKVRDAQILTFWMTGQLNRLFSSYISENGGQARALVIALNR